MVKRVIAAKINEDCVFLPESDLYHLRRVLRLEEGAEFEAISGTGRRYLCRLEREGRTWFGRIRGVSDTSWESDCRISLAQALIKKDKFEWVVQKAVELGVTEVIPIITYRTEVRLDAKQRGRRLSRWSKILAEAVKQCGRTRLPKILEPLTLEDTLGLKTEDLLLVLDEKANLTLKSLRSTLSVSSGCTLFVGPEAGWDDRDRSHFREYNTKSVRLGPRTLRTETAAVAGLTLLQYELGDLSIDPASFSVDYPSPAD